MAMLENIDGVFYKWSLSMTVITLFILGMLKAKFSSYSWFYCGLETCILGSIVALISYYIALFIEPLSENF